MLKEVRKALQTLYTIACSSPRSNVNEVEGARVEEIEGARKVLEFAISQFQIEEGEAPPSGTELVKKEVCEFVESNTSPGAWHPAWTGEGMSQDELVKNICDMFLSK